MRFRFASRAPARNPLRSLGLPVFAVRNSGAGAAGGLDFPTV
jgi:hypothetical protein